MRYKKEFNRNDFKLFISVILLFLTYDYLTGFCMKNSILLFVLIAIVTVVNAQTPEWTEESKRKQLYPETDYLIGFASEKNVNKEDQQTLLNRLESYAKSQLVEYIQVKVRSEAVMELSEKNDDVQRNYRSMYSATSNLELTGLKVEKFYDQKTRTGYVIAYSRKNDLYKYYKGLIESGLTIAAQKLEEAKSALSVNDIKLSLKSCLEVISSYPSIEEAQKVLLAIKAGSLNENDLQYERSSKLKSSTEGIIRQAQRNAENTVDDACFFIAQGLKDQTGVLNKTLILSNFTYQDTKMASELSRRLSQSLASKLVSESGYKIQTESTNGNSSYVLTGTFWKESNEIKVIASLKDLSGKIVATSEAFIPLGWFDTNKVSYLPENFEQAYSKMRVFNMNEIVKGDLNIEVWTNKGDDNLLYIEGERLKFSVRANKECYLRFVYHTADGQSVLLLDNYYIAENMINKVIELPYEFECAEPFGVETLQVNAQTAEFTKLSIVKKDGFDFIDESLKDIVVTTRGFRKLNDANVVPAEKRLMFTTMKK